MELLYESKAQLKYNIKKLNFIKKKRTNKNI